MRLAPQLLFILLVVCGAFFVSTSAQTLSVNKLDEQVSFVENKYLFSYEEEDEYVNPSPNDDDICQNTKYVQWEDVRIKMDQISIKLTELGEDVGVHTIVTRPLSFLANILLIAKFIVTNMLIYIKHTLSNAFSLIGELKYTIIFVFEYLHTSVNQVKHIVVDTLIIVSILSLFLLFVKNFVRKLWIWGKKMVNFFKKKSSKGQDSLEKKHHNSAVNVEKEGKRFENHRLVRIFLTPSSNNPKQVVPVGVYQFTHPTHKTQHFVHYVYTDPEHVEIAMAKLESMKKKWVCREESTPASHTISCSKTLKGSSGLLVVKKERQIDSSSIDTMSIPFQYEQLKQSDKNVPVIDVYGNIHENMISYLCHSVPMNSDFASTFHGGESNILGYYSAEESGSKSGQFNMKYIGANAEQASSSTKTAPRNKKVWECRDNVCNLKSQAESSSEFLRYPTPNMEEIKKRTNALKDIVKSENVQFEDMIRMCPSIEHLRIQINPESHSAFDKAKTLLSWIGSFTKLFPSTGDSVGDTTINLKEMAIGTKIRYGSNVDYNTFCKKARVGDMVVVHGFHTMSNIICRVQGKLRRGARFMSHVGIIVDTSVFIMPGMIEGEKYLLESAAGGGIVDSNYDMLPDVFGLARSGVQVRSLRGLLVESQQQHSLYFWCPLKSEYRRKFDENVGPDRKCSDKPCSFVSNMKKYLNKPYTFTPQNFFLGASNSNIDASFIERNVHKTMTNVALKYQTEIGREFFCSELVSSIYCDTGVLKPKMHIPWGRNLRDFVSEEELMDGFYIPRQVYPIDFFSNNSSLPYLFDDIHLMMAVANEKE